MANEIEKASQDPAGGGVRVGNAHPISMQTLQDIYNEITGKSETLSRSFRHSHKITFDDIEQLHSKVTQLFEQYNIVGHNHSITIYHIDDGKEEFSSFERFRIYDQSSLSPVENVRLFYNILIVLPKTERAQTYEIEINIQSRAGIKKRAEAEHGPARRFIRLFADHTGHLEIKYVDYTVARNFCGAIELWFDSLEKSSDPFLMGPLKDSCRNIPVLFRLLTAAALLGYFYCFASDWLTPTPGMMELFLTSILCFGSVYIASQLADRLGRILVYAIESFQPISYIRLNRGDDNAIRELRSSNRGLLIKGLLGLISAIGTNLIAAWIVTQFTE